MPRPAHYIHDIEEAIGYLERAEGSWVDRAVLQEALKIGKTRAWQIMRQLGAAAGPGNSLVLEREQALKGLRRILQGDDTRREIERHSVLIAKLESVARDTFSRRRTVVRDAAEAIGLRSQRFSKLPTGVRLTPDSLHIEFHGTEEFLRQLGAVIFAVQNDYAEVERYIEGRQK